MTTNTTTLLPINRLRAGRRQNLGQEGTRRRDVSPFGVTLAFVSVYFAYLLLILLP